MSSIAVADVTTLNDVASLLLDLSEDHLATTPDGAPLRAYVSPAAPAFDCCPFLSVHVSALSEEATSPLSPTPATGMRAKYQRINLATMVVTVVRCSAPVPKDGIPAVADLESVAAQVHADGWALWNGIMWNIRDGVFSDLCEVVHIISGLSIPEQGGCVGWQFTLSVQLAGIPNPPGT